MEDLAAASTLRCPRCREPAEPPACGGCGLAFVARGGVFDVIGATEREARAAAVESFYEKSPFPGYHPADDGPRLMDRLARVPFLVALDEAVPADARVCEVGCGTAQLSAYLALRGPRREVLAFDGCRASLEHADAFRERAGIENLELVRADLFDLPAPKEAFPIVVSRGVVHHTPDPDRATREVAARVAPGGILVLGFYETLARGFHCARRALAKPFGGPIRALDPVLRRRDLDPEKKRIWIEDQYRHPLEHILPLPRVVRVLQGEGFRLLRTVPPFAPGRELFEPAASPDGGLGRRLGWLLAGVRDPDAGLVCVIARRG